MPPNRLSFMMTPMAWLTTTKTVNRETNPVDVITRKKTRQHGNAPNRKVQFLNEQSQIDWNCEPDSVSQIDGVKSAPPLRFIEATLGFDFLRTLQAS